MSSDQRSPKNNPHNKMPVNIFYLSILLVAVIATLTAGHAVEREQPSALGAVHGYGPAVHISSGVLQLADDTETQLLLVPSVHSSPLAQPWPHFYVEGLTSHLPHVATLPQPTVHEPRIVISDNLDFSHHPSVKSHGR